MGTAITLLVILTVSVMVIRVAAVALRLTGLPDGVARFQARSAFTGTGYTTCEAEAVVNHPLRRRVISILMIVGNVGLVSVLATLVVSFVSTETSMGEMSRQALWLLGALVLLWLFALNPIADRLMCRSIGWVLRHTTSLDRHAPTLLVEVASGHRVAEHRVLGGGGLDGTALSELRPSARGLLVLGIRHADGSYASLPELQTHLAAGDGLVLYGRDDRHAALHEATAGASLLSPPAS